MLRCARFGLLACTCAALMAMPYDAIAACQLLNIAELPVTMEGLRPLVPAKINGKEALFLADSGAWYSIISPAAADQYGLRTYHAPYGLRVIGIGGTAEARATTVEKLGLANTEIPRIEFVVGGSDVEGRAVGVIGQNVLGWKDVEYDLAHGVIRIMRPGDGCDHAALAYWAGKSTPYTVMNIQTGENRYVSATKANAYLNGQKIDVQFDTGAGMTVLNLDVAKRAGFRKDGPNVKWGGRIGGFGYRVGESWIATFDSFKIGDEEIHNARLRVTDNEIPNVDMLIGADFFLSHRVYVANSRDRIYFTYNGGPVFNLNQVPADAQGADVAAISGDEEKDPARADEFSRRGAARESRHDFEKALQDFARAVEMNPQEPGYLVQRASVYRALGKPDEAMSDLDRAVTLAPSNVDALDARLRLQFSRDKREEGLADLDSAASLAPKEAFARLEYANFYEKYGQTEKAIAQYDLWIDAHRRDSRRADALNDRCWVRAKARLDLQRALDDCNDALDERGDSAEILDSRGLVYFQLGRYDRSIRDYTESLRIKPKNAWTLYCRGVARMRAGMTADGQADLAAATVLKPGVAQDAARFGVSP
jgi:tetratricopeptide (TPR) repeat protein